MYSKSSSLDVGDDVDSFKDDMQTLSCSMKAIQDLCEGKRGVKIEGQEKNHTSKGENRTMTSNVKQLQ